MRLVLPTTGEYPGTWGTQVNTGLTNLVDASIAGTASITMVAADYTLSTANGAADESRAMFLVLGGTPGGSYNVIVPAVSKLYFVTNSTGAAQTVKTSAGTGISVPNGARIALRCDGTNVIEALNYVGSLTIGSITLSTPLGIASGGTGSSSTTYCSLTANVSGTLPVGSGGTGATTLTGLVKGNGTSAFSAAVAGTDYVTPTGSETLSNKTLASPVMTGTPTAPTATAGTSTTQVATTAFVAATAFSPVLPGQTGNAGKFVTTDGTNASWADINLSTSVTGTLPIGNGGTGQTTANAALNALLPSQTGNSGKYVTTDGSNTSWAAVVAASLQEFTSSGTWTKPSGATFVMVEAWGAGGGGGSGRRGTAGSTRTSGGGGGGGAYAYRLFKATDLASSISVAIGAGGAGGAAVTVNSTDGNNGTAGGATTFGTLLSAFGGSGGFLGSTSAVNGGGGGGVLAGASGSSTGGTPIVSGAAGQAFGGGQSSTSSAAIPSGFGGAGGGGCSTAQGFSGGSSYQGGGGGGAGSVISSGNAFLVAGSGGGITAESGTGGVGVFYPGTAGTSGSSREGGGGGASSSASVLSVNNQSVAFGNSTFAVTSETGLIATSANGTGAWTFRSNPSNLATPWILHDGTKFVLFNSTATQCWTTTDFTTYTTVTGLSSGITVQRVRYANSNYFVMGSSAQLWRSTDLVTWTQVTSGNAGIIYDICWSGTNYVCVSASTPQVRYSANLSSWSTPTTYSSGSSMYSCESNGSGTVVIQSDASVATCAQRSTDNGVNFSNVATTLVQASGSRGLLFANSTWLAASLTDIWSSTDGNTWTSRLTGAGGAMTGFAWDGTTFVAGITANSSTMARTAVPAALGTWTNRTVTAVNTAAGAGGAGGSIGGGGGGGGASLNDNNSGAGGTGGNGFVRVYTW